MKLLFICTHNRCRSILAEAIANHVGGPNIVAASAGSSPQGVVHPLSLKYLQEHQISIDGLKSQSWSEFEGFNPDAILTLCDSPAQEACPAWFGSSVQVHWGLEDPSKGDGDELQQRQLFNNTIEILERRVKSLLEHDLSSLSGASLKDTLQGIATKIS